MAQRINFDPISTAFDSLLRPLARNRPSFAIWYQQANDCDRMVFWISLFDVVIAYADPELLRDLARMVNAEETLVNRQIVQELNKQTQAFYDAAKQSRLS